MKVHQVLFVLLCIKTGLASWRNLPPGVGGDSAQGAAVQDVRCDPVEGPVGPPGSPGMLGYPGPKGEKGEPRSSLARPPPGTGCRCPVGHKGAKGEIGAPGYHGVMGAPGSRGFLGEKGNEGPRGTRGRKGMPGPPLPRYPPNNPNAMFIPVTFNGRVPRAMCQHIRKQAFVPGAPHDWLGWYETGKSSYLTFNKWLYFSSRFQCPCSVPIPPGPTPSPAELLRLL